MSLIKINFSLLVRKNANKMKSTVKNYPVKIGCAGSQFRLKSWGKSFQTIEMAQYIPSVKSRRKFLICFN